MQDLYGDLKKVSQKPATLRAPSTGAKPVVAVTETEPPSAEPGGSSLMDLIKLRRKKDEENSNRNVLSPREEALSAREEELDRRELSVRQAEINLVRRIENDRRAKEDGVRREEDERRRQEEVRRALEDERRRSEDSRRKMEDEDVAQLQLKIKQHEMMKTQRQERLKQREVDLVLSKRKRQLEDMLIFHQTQDPTVVDFAPFLVDRIDAVVAQNSDVENLDALFSLVISDGATKYSDEQKGHVASRAVEQKAAPKVAAQKPSEATKASTAPPARGTVISDDEDGFFMLDESPVQTKKSVVPPTSPAQVLSSVNSSARSQPRVPSDSSKPPETQAVQRALSSDRTQQAAASLSSQTQREQVNSEDSEDDEDDPEFWVMLDATDDPAIDVSSSSRLNIIKKIQRHLLGNSPRVQRTKRAQEFPLTLTRTDTFKEARKQASAKRVQDLQSQITRLLPSVERLADSDTQFDPIANFDSWNPLKKLVISNKETWNACGECGEYFDMLSIKHNCRLCLKAVCSKCGVESKSFSPTLLGVSSHRNVAVDAKCCKSCRNAISTLQRQQDLQKTRSNPRFRAFGDKYEQASRSKSKILECIAALDEIVTAIGPRMLGASTASSVSADKLQQLSKSEKSLVLALQEYQDLISQIGKIMESFAKPSSPDGPVQAEVEKAEYRFLSYLRQSMIAFLTENRKLITHYKVLKQGMGLDDAKDPKPPRSVQPTAEPPTVNAKPASTSSVSISAQVNSPVLAPAPQVAVPPAHAKVAEVPPTRPKSPPPPYRPPAGK